MSAVPSHAIVSPAGHRRVMAELECIAGDELAAVLELIRNRRPLERLQLEQLAGYLTDELRPGGLLTREHLSQSVHGATAAALERGAMRLRDEVRANLNALPPVDVPARIRDYGQRWGYAGTPRIAAVFFPDGAGWRELEPGDDCSVERIAELRGAGAQHVSVSWPTARVHADFSMTELGVIGASSPVFTIAGHPRVRSSSTPARIVAAIGADVRTPGSVSGVDRERLAAMLEQLEPGQTLELEPLGVIRGAHLARDTPRAVSTVRITRNR